MLLAWSCRAPQSRERGATPIWKPHHALWRTYRRLTVTDEQFERMMTALRRIHSEVRMSCWILGIMLVVVMLRACT